MSLAAVFAIGFAIGSLHLMAAVSPGPAVLMSARMGIRDGFRAGLFLSIGIGLGRSWYKNRHNLELPLKSGT